MKLFNFKKEFIDQELENLFGEYSDSLFYNCKFRKLNGLTLKNCSLNRSKFVTEQIEELLGFTVTVDCKSFAGVELSELIFDLLLVLLYQTKGNDSKRRQLVKVIGKKRLKELLSKIENLE